jgi:hypothetical protein
MFWTIVFVIAGYILVRFIIELVKDQDDLQYDSLDEKFKFIVNTLNEAAYKGRGSVYRIDKREFNLYKEGDNQIIKFHYSTGHLTIRWKYKYFQKEVIHERQFNHVRNLSIFEQQKIANQMINEMNVVIVNHAQKVRASI